MDTRIILFTALLPVAVLMYYIYNKDRKSPEPIEQLIKAFLFGTLSVPLSFCISIPLELIGAYTDEPTSILGSICTSFFGAAIPEETAKLVMLWLFLRKNPYFDEKVDGIVYAVCVSLGFAAVENVLYLFSDAESYLSIGIVRAIFTVPGHFCDGVLMGYYYSLAKFYPQTPKKNKVLILLAPVIVHGLYDSILFLLNVTPDIFSGILIILFIVFCFKVWKYGSKRIEEHLQRDEITLEQNSMKREYSPQPIETDDVVLPEELDALGEEIAKNVHEVWAQSRMQQGWTYGAERNDTLKQHPCLIPYEELPEEEKAYDRDTAFGTLKLIRKLGFKISKE